MKLYIKCIDGQIIDHPVTYENLSMIYGHFDDQTIPTNYVKFKRGIFTPVFQPYKYSEAVYALIDDIVEEVYIIKDMTDEQKQAKIDLETSKKPYDSWVFDVDNCIWKAPVNYPNDGNKYGWNETNLTWDAI